MSCFKGFLGAGKMFLCYGMIKFLPDMLTFIFL